MIYLRIAVVFAALAFIFAGGLLAYGKDTTSYQCVPVNALVPNNTEYKEATQEQLRFLQAAYIVQKWAPDDLPPGDKALYKRVGDTLKVIFLDGDQACASMLLYKAGSDAVDQIGRGEINHAGKGT